MLQMPTHASHLLKSNGIFHLLQQLLLARLFKQEKTSGIKFNQIKIYIQYKDQEKLTLG